MSTLLPPTRIGNRNRTKGVPPATEAMNSLPVHIMDGEKLVRVVEIPDPRIAFCREFNSLETGHIAIVADEMTVAYAELEAMKEGTSPDAPTDVWLIDPRGDSDPEMVYAAASQREAEIWIAEWNREPLGMVAVLTAANERPDVKGGDAGDDETNEDPVTGPLVFRLGLFEPAKPDDIEFVGPMFEPCRVDMLAMQLAIREYATRGTDRRMAVFIVEEAADAEGGAA